MAYKWIFPDKLVRRLADDAQIPADPENRDWRRVLEWVAAGNAIAAADPPPPPLDISDINNLDKALKALGLLIAQYTGKTPAQVRTDFMAIYRGLP